MTDKSDGPYRKERWEAQNEYVITGPDWNKFPGVFNRIEADRIVPILNIGYAAGFKAGVEEFRELAARFCEDSVGSNYLGFIEYEKDPEELAAGIRALPVRRRK